MTRKTYRVQHKFWLDITRPGEDWLDDKVHQLKQGRAFAKTIRDALSLIFDLRAGNLDVLLTLFPFVREAVLEQYSSPQNPETETLMRIEQLLLQQGNTPIADTKSGPKKLNVPQFDVPGDEEGDTQLIIKVARRDGDSAKNFLDSAFNLVQ